MLSESLRRIPFLATCAVAAAAAPPAAPLEAASPGACMARSHDGADYVVCRFDAETSDIRLFLHDGGGEPYGHFNRVKETLAEKGERLVFAMNAGMYRADRAPVGLYVEHGDAIAPLNANDGPGNFHLKPNGVFFVSGVRAGVEETQTFLNIRQHVDYATQSGPMLVVGGDVHPRFLPASDSLKRRNGVGVTAQGEVIFVLADSPVRFYDFALFFRDELETPNALYLDGTVSRLYAPELGRNDPGVAMGPIVAVIASD